MLKMEQQLDTLSPEDHKRYMHNYNFPPYSVGETGRVGSPKRREIGHGALAERALVPVLPTREEFPYAIRQVSEALGSNGSTSMGSVWGRPCSAKNATSKMNYHRLSALLGHKEFVHSSYFLLALKTFSELCDHYDQILHYLKCI